MVNADSFYANFTYMIFPGPPKSASNGLTVDENRNLVAYLYIFSFSFKHPRFSLMRETVKRNDQSINMSNLKN